jgi:hypothetical protein
MNMPLFADAFIVTSDSASKDFSKSGEQKIGRPKPIGLPIFNGLYDEAPD